MEEISLVEFDIRGANPVNRFMGEKIKLIDKTSPYVIPNASPYFEMPNFTKLYNEQGGELRPDIDYWLVGEFTPFCELSGKSVLSFVKLSQDVLDENEFIKMDYQSIGANFVPRNSLLDWMNALDEGGRDIPFDPKVQGVPETLPPKLHWHSVKTEVSGWDELTFFFQTLSGSLNSADSELKDRVNASVNTSYDELNLSRDLTESKITEHDNNIDNPHNMTAADLKLGNVDNFRTATEEEEYEGLREDVFSTALGVSVLSTGLSRPKVTELTDVGHLPISRWIWGGLIESDTENNITHDGWNINILVDSLMLLNSVPYYPKATTINLEDYAETLANRTFYIYVAIREQKPTYLVSNQKLRLNSKMLLLLVVETDSVGVSKLTPNSPFMIDGFEITTERKGNSIPVSTGGSQNPGEFKVLKEVDLLD